MAIQQTLRPFRDYNEKDVINLYSVSGAPIDTTYQIIATKGSLVKIVGAGFVADQDPETMIGNYGLFNTNNFVGQRYGVTSQVALSSATDSPIGMLLFDVRELDENGEFLKYRPQKAAEMEAVLSGQACPMVTKGRFIVSGIVTGTTAITAGSPVYAAANGGFATSTAVTGKQIGVFLGGAGVTGSYGDSTTTALIQLSL
jgi:hypothetical protein